jgi:cyclopropane fatty-acyl-phospholipid synthase-like methyltransferase
MNKPGRNALACFVHNLARPCDDRRRERQLSVRSIAIQRNIMSADSRTDRWLEQSRGEWNDRAGFFDELSARNAAGDDRKTELDFVSSTLNLQPGSRLLDAGCGPGHFAIAFAERGCIVDGVDLSDEMIERARANADAADVTIRFTTGDLAALDAPDGA